MNMQLTKTYKDKLQLFYDAFSAGVTSIVAAGELLVELVEENENTYELIVQRFPEIKLGTLELLERLGRHEVYLPVFLDESYAARKLLDMPAKKQEEIFNHPIPVAVKIDGEIKTENKRINELTRKEADIVLDTLHGRLRTIAEQTKLVTQIEKEKAKIERMRYIIEANGITFLATTTLTFAELEDLLSKYKASALVSLQKDMQAKQIKA